MRKLPKSPSPVLLLLLSGTVAFCNQTPRQKEIAPTGDAAGAATGSEPEEAGFDEAGAGVPVAKDDETRFKEAVELAESDQPGKALPILQKLDGKMGPLTDYHLFYTAGCHLSLGRGKEARVLLESLLQIKGSVFRHRIPLMIAQSYFLDGSYEKAASTYEEALKKSGSGGKDEAEVRMMLARCYEKADMPLKAKAIYGEVIRTYPFAEEATAAADAMKALVPNFTLTEAWKSDRVEAFEKKRMFNAALDEFETLTVPKKKEDKQAHLYKKAALMYKARKSYDDALKILMNLVGQKSSLSDRAILLAARIKQRKGDIKGARVLFQLYIKRYPSSSQKGDVLLSLLKLDVQENRWSFIIKNYTKFSAGKSFLSDDELRELRWILAFSHFLMGDPHKAGKLFAAQKKGAADRMESMKADYWHGVTLQIRGKKKDAVKAFKTLMDQNPLHYYSVLAFMRLGDMNETVSIPAPPASSAAPQPDAKDPCGLLPDNVQMLMDMGLKDLAKEEMKNRRAAILDKYGSNPDRLLEIFECGGAMDTLFQELSGKYNKYTYYYPYEDIISYWKILYPRFHMDQVTAVSGEHGVPPLLTLSIIRQESRFDPDALSYAGAMGLMQLMPATARQVAGELGETYDREALFDGSVNMRYGVYYLSKLLKKFDGNIPLAAASYNGGPHNVGTWLKQKWSDRLDLFVELIPYVQTRNYVRRVTTSLIRYTYLYEGTLKPMTDMLARKPDASFKQDPSY